VTPSLSGADLVVSTGNGETLLRKGGAGTTRDAHGFIF
jgi:hypothetical protein